MGVGGDICGWVRGTISEDLLSLHPDFPHQQGLSMHPCSNFPCTYLRFKLGVSLWRFKGPCVMGSARFSWSHLHMRENTHLSEIE